MSPAHSANDDDFGQQHGRLGGISITKVELRSRPTGLRSWSSSGTKSALVPVKIVHNEKNLYLNDQGQEENARH